MSYGMVRSRWYDPDGVLPTVENQIRVEVFPSDVGDWLNDWLHDNPEIEVLDIIPTRSDGYPEVLVVYRGPLEDNDEV